MGTGESGSFYLRGRTKGISAGAAKPDEGHDPRKRFQNMAERLQKVLAAAGIGSRRFCESLIAAGRVSVDGKVVQLLGAKVTADARIEVDGRPIRPTTRKVYYLLNKPAGYVSTMKDTHGRPAIPDLLRACGISERVFPVGRLDLETEGLLLLTNDGELANAIMHPRHGVEKTYLAWVQKTPSCHAISALSRGVMLEEGRTAPAKVKLVDPRAEPGIALVELVIHEGRKRQVRRMLAAVGHPVVRLVRVAIDGIRLQALEPGRIRALTDEELAGLRHAVGLAAGRKP